MKISLKETNIFCDDFWKIARLYNTAFPADERAPFAMLAAKARLKNVDMWSVCADGEWAGLAYVVSEADISYLFYFAIAEEKRGIGVGSKTLKALKNMYAERKFFLALEQLDPSADNYPERQKRRRFYLNNGLKAMNRVIREVKVVYDVMGVGGEIDPADYGKMMKNYLGFPMNKLVSKGQIAMEIKEGT